MPIDLKKISHEAAGLVTAVCLINETVAKVATGLLKKKKATGTREPIHNRRLEPRLWN